MEFRSKVQIEKGPFDIDVNDRVLLVGSCFADNIGKQLATDKFDVLANPYGVMYNPASICHTVEKLHGEGRLRCDVAVFTLGTNHVYVLNETGEIVDNCQKKPQRLFTERELSVAECGFWLNKAIDLLKSVNPDVHVIVTVSPVRYAKYGFHGSQLAKATLLLAANELDGCAYFPAYEIMNDELRDYRFYQPDMVHPSAQAVEYIYTRFQDVYFTKRAKDFLQAWQPYKKFFAHKPFDEESEEYLRLKDKMSKEAEDLLHHFGHDVNHS